VAATGIAVEPVLAPESLIRFVGGWNRRRTSSARTSDAEPVPALELGEEISNKLRCRYAARRAIRAVRGLPEMPTLRKGGHLSRTLSLPEQSTIVRSFATIYLLLLVLPERFDEIRAKHALAQTLPAIENLVLSLPPRTPNDPEGAAGAMRRRR